jgi:enoyl-CoA hydratase/carnithine racemase
MSDEPDSRDVRRAYETVLVQADDGVLTLTLHRPDQLNAISAQLEDELWTALGEADRDPAVRAIVITGAGRAFCAGYDLGDEPAAGGERRAADAVRRAWRSARRQQARYLDLMRLETPVIAAVNGWCLGGGLWYALACDITIASERAVFGQPEVRETGTSTFLLAALVGWKHAHRYALTGDHFDAAEALRIGAVNEVVAHEQLLATAHALAARIARLAPDGVRMTKAMTWLGLEAMGLGAGLEAAGLVSVAISASVDNEDLDELHRIRAQQSMRASVAFRDRPFIPEPGGPRSAPTEQRPGDD